MIVRFSARYGRAFATLFKSAVLMLSSIASGCAERHLDRHAGGAASFPEAVAHPVPSSAGGERAEIPSNDACYVCHMPFADEPLAQAHDEAEVRCGDCHGPSGAHVADENIGATPPDITYEKDQVEPMCGKCHLRGEHPEVSEETRAARLAEGEKAQKAIKGGPVEISAVCTDCHGRHWIPPMD